MDRLKRLIIEAHRRSLWQVLGLYFVTSWIVIQVVGQLTQAAGLPDWVPGFSLALLLVGLPIVLATAFVQEGGPGQGRAPAAVSPEPVEPPRRTAARRSFLRRNLTWSRALLGGIAAFAALSLFVGAYFVSWSMGIGPASSLVARGEIERGERIVLADFGTLATDTTLGRVVTDALRIDLLESPVLRVVEAAELRETLARMRFEADSPLTSDVAREVALREGVKAVLAGEVAQAGTGFVLTATLLSAETGRSLAALRETAAGPDDIVTAIDRLSRRIRERAGESLRSINAGQPLQRVTTTSLDALRLFSDAERAFDQGDYRRAIALLDEAVTLDPGFAMALRRIGVLFGNTEADRDRELEAYTRAYELRDRLSARERHLAEARYHGIVLNDRDAMMAAYRRVLRIDPDDRHALNNLAAAYIATGDEESGVELLQRAIDGPAASHVAFGNLFSIRVGQGRFEEALAVADAYVARYPDNFDALAARFWGLFLTGEQEAARRQTERLLASSDPNVRATGHDLAARLALWRGQLPEARLHLAEAERAAAEVEASRAVTRRLFTAQAEVVVGNHARAIELVRSLESDGTLDELTPSNHWHFFRANVLGMAGAADEAEAVMQAFDDEVPPEQHARFWVRNTSARSFIAIVRGEPEAAVRMLDEIRARAPCEVCYAERMGWALAEAGRLPEAAQEWEIAVTWADRTHATIWQMGQLLWTLQRIGPLYEQLGDTARALHHYGRLTELWADADAELQPVVRHARERMAALGGRMERTE